MLPGYKICHPSDVMLINVSTLFNHGRLMRDDIGHHAFTASINVTLAHVHCIMLQDQQVANK